MVRKGSFGFLVLLMLLTTGLFAQREQIVVRSEFFPAVATDPSSGTNGEVSAFSQFFALGKRSVLNEEGSAVLTSTLSYRYTSLNYTFDSPGLPVNGDPEGMYRTDLANNGVDLHLIRADLLYMKILNRKWLLYALGRPMMASDLDGVDIEDFRLEAAVFTEYRFGRKFRGGLGISRSSSFGRVLWVPLARIFYRPARKVLIEGILPSRLDAWYIPSKNWEYGLGVSLIGAQFSVSENNALNGNQFGWANGIASLQVKRLLKGKWYAQVDAGLSIIPRQELIDYDFNFFPSWNPDLRFELNPDPTPVIRVGFFKVF